MINSTHEGKLGSIRDHSGIAGQRPRGECEDLEVLTATVGIAQTNRWRRDEAESAVVGRIAQHNHPGIASLTALVEALPDQCSSNAMATVGGKDGNRRQPQALITTTGADGAEGDMPNHGPLHFSNQGNDQVGVLTQIRNQAPLGVGGETGGVDAKHGLLVADVFLPNDGHGGTQGRDATQLCNHGWCAP